MIKNISPQEAKRLVEEENALLIDIREPDEFAHEHIDGVRLMPLSVFTLLAPAPDRERSAIFHCQSGNRTQGSTEILEAHGFADNYMLEGGLTGWKEAGFNIVAKKAPIPLPRQIQIVAGSMIIIFSLLNFFIPAFNWLTLLVGANLVFAGSTGICFAAKILMSMPWNKKKLE